MRNVDLIDKKLNIALEYLYEQEQKLKPFIDKLTELLLEKIDNSEIDIYKAFEMYVQLQEQYTNSILLITKMQEIIDFKD